MYRFPAYSAFLLGCALLVGAGCSRSSTTTQGEASRETTNTAPAAKGTAFVRYVSAVKAHDNTDLYFGDTQLFSTTNAAKPTDYKDVPAERRDFTLREAGNPNGVAIDKNSEGLSDGKHYTVVAYEDKDAKPVIHVFNDDESAPAAGKAKLRIIHAAGANEAVDVYVSGQKDKLASESSLTSSSTWQDINPVKGTIEVRTGSGKDAQVTRIPNTNFDAGKLYTLVVEGSGKTGQKLSVVQMENSPTS
jgi:hypothetical protein